MANEAPDLIVVAPRTGLKKGPLLLALVGLPTLLTTIPLVTSEESGRSVAVSVAPSGQAVIKHLSGPMYLDSYLDSVKVATICDGLTGKDIKLGVHFTEAQCSAMLEERLAETASHVMACTPGLALTVPRRDNVRTATVSLAYNVGWPAYCRSSIPAKINAGRIRAACDTLLDFNKAGGRVLRGLTARRQREQVICLKDAA